MGGAPRLSPARRLAPCTPGNSRLGGGRRPRASLNRLVGQQLLQVDEACAAVPLLNPCEHSLPFSVALIVHDHAPAANAPPPPPDRAHVPPAPAAPLVELLYCVSGAGHFFSADGRGAPQPVAAGDSVIAPLGHVQFAAGEPPPGDAAPHEPLDQEQQAPGWWMLLPWLQQQQRQQQQQQQQQSRADAGRLVMLQLLLPEELLSGKQRTHRAGHCREVEDQLPWASSRAAGRQGRVVDRATACGLLAGSKQLWPAQEQQQQQQQHTTGGRGAPGVSSGPLHNRQGNSGDGSSTSTSSSTSVTTSSSSRGSVAAMTLPSPTQVLKRGISEVAAFRLPNQSNRLALLMGPHVSPAVSLSFGVEVFEPGHVTPRHVHRAAHELFFILGGSGVAVFGPGSGGGETCVELSAGDVAVFPPGERHAIDNPTASQLYCLQMMVPNEDFVQYVQSGDAGHALSVGDLLAAAAGCG